MKILTLTVLAAAMSAGCGIITGLSNDYTFVADDGGHADDAATDGTNSATDGAADSAPATCEIPRSQFSDACRSCLPAECCAFATCLADDGCKHYAFCLNQCSAGNQSCFKVCENRASSSTRNMLQDAISRCNFGGSCENSCNWAL